MKKLAKVLASAMLICATMFFAGNEKEEDMQPILGVDNWVDLGLPSGLLWATCNVGANSPEDYGDYFAWGETQPQPKGV